MACDCLYLGAGPSGTGGAVASVFGRVGTIVGVLGDYDSALIGDVSNFGGPTVQDSLNAAKLAVDAAQTDATQALADAAAAQATADAPPVDAATGTLAILHGGTGEPTASAAFAALAPIPGADGRVIRSDGAAWQSAVLGVADVSGAAPSASPIFTGTVDADGATSVLVPTVPFPSSTTDAASTAYVATGLATKVNATGGTLTGGTIAGSTSISGTATAAGGSTIALAGATAVTVPTVAFPDSDTSAASTAYVAAAFANGAIPLDYHATSRFTPASSTAPGLITYLTLNFTAIGGVYFLAGVGGLTGSSSTTQIRAALIIDSVNQGGPYLETGITNGVSILGTPSSFAFAAGAHTISLAFEHAGGPGTTTSFFAVIQVWKVA